ncbi:TrbI/VirB10 family protein [Pseudorhodoferax sp.]|uniref:TrbI/VirB10 family protein n=1 Tax=Pseudorhodoferax sp. TaxID=1993553 RepID=UPI0039E42A46
MHTPVPALPLATMAATVPPAHLADPRRTLDAQALALASRNAFPVVAGHVQRRDRFGLAAGAACALALGAAAFWSLSQQRTPPLPAPPPPAPALPAPGPVAAPPPAPAARPRAVPQPDPRDLRANAPSLIVDMAPAAPAPAPAGHAPPAEAPVAAKPGNAPRGAQQPLSAEESFAERIGSSAADTVGASRLADPAHTVVQGSLIAAVLETAIDSDLPGYARAVVSQDLRSFDGSRVLVPRGSRLIGQYKSNVANGQKRAYVMWSRLLRPDGVSIALASPATDFAGSTGMAGEVDTHFIERFGSAVMLSVVEVFAAIGTAATVISGAQSAAAVAAQRDAQIPPTIRVPQGTPVRVFVARDLDFSGLAAEER